MRVVLVMALVAGACGGGSPGTPADAANDASDAPDATADAVDAPTDSAVAVLSVAPAMLDLGFVCGADAVTGDVTVTNTGLGAEPISFAVTGPNASSFEIAVTTCATLAPGSTCTATVRFRPLSTGAKAANVTASAPSGASATFSAMGAGGACSYLAESPGSLSFGPWTLPSTSATQTVTIKNVSHTITTPAFDPPTLGGAAPGEFQIFAETCSGVALAPGQLCTIDVRYRPTMTGPHTATVTVSAPAGPVMQFTVSGEGVSPVQLSASPTICDVNACLGGAAECTVTIANGGVASDVVSFAISGSNAARFTVHDTTCTGPLAPGSSCTATVRFTPTSPGSVTAALTTSAPVSMAAPVITMLAGTGFSCGSILITPRSLTFAPTGVGATSAPQTFTLVNPGGSAMGPLVLALSGAGTGDFELVSDTCSGATLLPAIGECTVGVQFHPTATGPRSADLDVRGGSLGFVTAALSGTGL